MKLYFASNTCSLSPHIVLRELGLPHELVRVNNQTKQTTEGRNFLEVNPKGYVAALRLDNGNILTEGPAILQYLADLKPEAGLAPRNGSWERTRLQEWLNFITAELHAGCSPLFSPEMPEAAREIFKKKLYSRLYFVSDALSKQDHLLETYSVADAYLYTVLRWLPFFEVDLQQWHALARYSDRIGMRPAVRSALEAEAAAPIPRGQS